eukprot:m.85867 g.85867  ORF g.85867 m.85867 type:complete len:342 (-) comp14743_c0_seq4:572-1597(-)
MMTSYQPALRPLNTFAGSSVAIDRLNNNRRDMTKLISESTAPSTVFLLLDTKLKVLGSPDGNRPLMIDATMPLHHTLATVVQDEAKHRDWMLVGRVTEDQPELEKLKAGTLLFVVRLDSDFPQAQVPEHVQLDVRAFALATPDNWLHSVVAHARSVFEFYNRHSFCGQCARPTRVLKGGHELACMDQNECTTSWFPRSDPVVIMLVVDPVQDACLLGRQARWPPGLHSCLAGFMEHGEAAEEAVAREVVEESSVVTTQARYHSSQPWPFPYSLMLGFVAKATRTTIQVDPDELEAARWFTRQDIQHMLTTEHNGCSLPPKGTIAHALCQAFANNDPVTQYE